MFVQILKYEVKDLSYSNFITRHKLFDLHFSFMTSLKAIAVKIEFGFTGIDGDLPKGRGLGASKRGISMLHHTAEDS